MEEWRSIPGYEGIYEASNLGRIKSVAGKRTINARCNRTWKERIMKLHLTKRSKGYNAMVTLWKDGKHKQLLVARLVAMTWCEGYKEDLTVNHIDGNPLNNKVENLEWVTLSDNLKHAHRTGLNPGSKKVTLVGKDGNRHEFYSMSEASRFLGRKPGYLSVAIGHGTRIYSTNGDVYGLV